MSSAKLHVGSVLPFAGLLGLAALTGCQDNDLSLPPHATATQLVYAPSLGTIPVPNDLLFSGTVDATLNFPPASDPAQQPLFDSLNSLDGWGTSAPISFAFDGPVDPLTVVGGTTVRVFEVDAAVSTTTGLKIGTPLVDIIAELSSPAQFVVAPAASDPTNASYAIVPTQPLKPATAYMVAVTNGVLDDVGDPVDSANEYKLSRVPASEIQYPADHPFFALQALVNAMETLVTTDTDVTGPPAIDDLVVTFSFTTQGVGDVLGTSRLIAQGNEGLVLAGIAAAFPGHPAGVDAPANQVPTATIDQTPLPVGSPGGLAFLHTGELTLPYYLGAASNGTAATPVTDTTPLTEFWHARYTFPFGIDTEANISRYNPLPLQSGAETVPMLISYPDDAQPGVPPKPANGWPVVIYQHGITSDRSSLLGLADRMALAGYACVAIDMPLHGLADAAADPLGGLLFAGYQDGGVRERTFGLDLVTQTGSTVTAAVPDGTADTSGAHYINFNSLRTQRDNLRQSVADLFGLYKVIQDDLDVDGGGADDLDPTEVHFVGISLGAMVGTPFSALETDLATTTLNTPGGGIPRFLEASPAYSSTVIGGLLAAGIVQGTPEFDQFMWAAQTSIDAGDPVNYCTTLAGGTTPILLQEVVGDGTFDDLFGLTDQVIPNTVTGAPLSGTEPMIALLGLTAVSTGTVVTTAGVVRFEQGGHSSLLTPTPDIDGDGVDEVDGTLTAANAEMQNEIADWLDDAGAQVTISDDNVVQ